MKVKRRSVCQNCRDRKLGCDGKRPGCSQCVLTGRACDGYQSDWTFIAQCVRPSVLDSTHNQNAFEHSKRKAHTVFGSSNKNLPNGRQQVGTKRITNSHSLSTFRPRGRPSMSEIAELVRNDYLPQILATLGHYHHEEAHICGAWVEVLPVLPCLNHDASVLSKATRALATLLASQKDNPSRKCDVESPESYHDAIHTLRGQITANGLSFELMPAIMCLALAELMLPDSVPALKMHLQAIGTLFQSFGPEALSSGIAHKLFLGFRPFIIGEAVRDRQPTFLATESWMSIPFSVAAPSHAQEVFSRAAALPAILQQVDIFLATWESSLKSLLALKALIGSLLGVSNYLSSWEKTVGLTMSPTIPSILDLGPSNFEISHISSRPICFPNMSVANGLTHCWAFQIVCMMEIENIVSRFPGPSGICDELAEDMNHSAIRAEADRLAYLICSSMSYLLQEEMKLFGPVSTLFPAQIAHCWFEKGGARYQSGIEFMRGVVTQLVQKGLLSAPLLVFGESAHRIKRMYHV